jgi:hypothetical protein
MPEYFPDWSSLSRAAQALANDLGRPNDAFSCHSIVEAAIRSGVVPVRGVRYSATLIPKYIPPEDRGWPINVIASSIGDFALPARSWDDVEIEMGVFIAYARAYLIPSEWTQSSDASAEPAADVSDGRQPPKPGPKSKSGRMRAALEELKADGIKFVSKKAAHDQVMKKLGKLTKRGWSYETFRTHCSDLLEDMPD